MLKVVVSSFRKKIKMIYFLGTCLFFHNQTIVPKIPPTINRSLKMNKIIIILFILKDLLIVGGILGTIVWLWKNRHVPKK